LRIEEKKELKQKKRIKTERNEKTTTKNMQNLDMHENMVFFNLFFYPEKPLFSNFRCTQNYV